MKNSDSTSSDRHISECLGFNVALDTWGRVFPGNRLYWHWQPNNNKEEIY